jgi:hypothetical protein
MNSHPLTPREILEERRLWRYWLRWFVKHNPRRNPKRACALVTDYLAWVKVQVTKKHLEYQTQLLNVLILPPKFCNGLIGVSLTDSVPAPAI